METGKIMEWVKQNKSYLIAGVLFLIIVAIGTYQYVKSTIPAPVSEPESKTDEGQKKSEPELSNPNTNLVVKKIAGKAFSGNSVAVAKSNNSIMRKMPNPAIAAITV